MKEKHKQYDEMDCKLPRCWLMADVLMDIIEPNEIVEESFNCVIDKGTFDCIACAEDGP